MGLGAIRAMIQAILATLRNKWSAVFAVCLLVCAPPVVAQDAAIRGFVELDRPLQYGEYFWDETDVPAGDVIIVADLDADQLYVYRGGYEMGRSTFIQGSLAKSTPVGVYPILEKKADHYSNLYDNAPMPHMLRLTWDGIAIHGSATISDDFATRGCIGLPRPFAAKLFAHAKKGTTVIVTRRWKPEVYW
jgi:L,D-transpeptidase catalytic domain